MWVFLLDGNEERLARHRGLCSTTDMQPRCYGELGAASLLQRARGMICCICAAEMGAWTEYN
eukprot:7601028-Pyramimonas_sp.AAC.1